MFNPDEEYEAVVLPREAVEAAREAARQCGSAEEALLAVREALSARPEVLRCDVTAGVHGSSVVAVYTRGTVYHVRHGGGRSVGTT